MLRCIVHDKHLDAAGLVDCVLGVTSEDAKDAVDAETKILAMQALAEITAGTGTGTGMRNIEVVANRHVC